MPYPHIMAEIARTPWAITPEALRAAVAAIDGKLTSADYPTFHGAGESEQVAVASMLGSRIPDSRLSFLRDGTGSLQINGPIVPRADAFDDMSGASSIERLTAEFRALEANADVKRILLVIDSPGGAVTGISEFATMLAASSKPLTAYVYGHAASAAYWIASAADEIIVGDTSIVGSIGTVMSLRKNDADTVEIVSSQSPKKRPDLDSEEDIEDLRALLDGISDVFISTVATNRNTTAADVLKNYGRGGVLLPAQAIKVGMVDGMMTLEAYLDTLATGGDSKDTSKMLDSRKNSVDNNGSGDSSPETEIQEARMNLTELLKEHPEAAAEIDAIKAKAVAEGRVAAVAETNERNAQASAILVSTAYPAAIKAIAADVVAGKRTPEHLAVAVSVLDAMEASEQVAGATSESAALPATPPENIETPSADRVLRSAADVDAAAEALKAGR